MCRIVIHTLVELASVGEGGEDMLPRRTLDDGSSDPFKVR